MKKQIILALAMLATASVGIAATNFDLKTGKRLITVNFWNQLVEFCETCELDDNPADCSPTNTGEPCTCNGGTQQASQLSGSPDTEENCEILRKP